jgi:hypothetical protein
MASEGLVDVEGFADDRKWLRHTALCEYPDAPRRLVEALTGDHLVNHATVLFSTLPGRAWGWKSAKLGSWLRGGHLESTHGGLDRSSSVGFYLPDDADRVPDRRVIRACDALAGFPDLTGEAPVRPGSSAQR